MWGRVQSPSLEGSWDFSSVECLFVSFNEAFQKLELQGSRICLAHEGIR